ncbi:hypothetical protein D3C87_703220 [compost metagenome]
MKKVNLTRIANLIGKFTGWDKNPASVFILAIPLALLGFSLCGAVAYLHYRLNGDMVYFWILVAGLALLGIGLYPAWRMHKNLVRMRQLP